MSTSCRQPITEYFILGVVHLASRDFRHAFRAVLRTPLFSASVVALLAVGLGANIVIFTLADTLLLRRLPVAKPEQLVRLGAKTSPTQVSYDFPYFLASILRARARSFTDIFVSWPLEMVLNSGAHSESIAGETVSGNYFSALGLTAERGRLLSMQDEKADTPVAVISTGLAERLFGGRNAVGSSIVLRGSQFTIVGVLGPAFRGTDWGTRTDVWLTMSAGKLWFASQDNARAASHIFLRLREGVRQQDAEAEVRAINSSLTDADLTDRSGIGREDIEREKAFIPSLDSVARGISSMRQTFYRAVSALMGAVATLLLLICANIGGLMAARSGLQIRDAAIRLSLGAPRTSILLCSFFEVFLLSFAGTAGGWWMAHLSASLLPHFLPQKAIANELTPDYRILIFAAIACLVTTALVALFPIVRALRIDPSAVLGHSGGGRSSGRRLSRGLVACQAALSTTLLLGGVSLVRTLDLIRSQDPGFRPRNLVVMTVNPRIAGIPSGRILQIFQEIVRKIEALPAVESVALADSALLHGTGLKVTVGMPGSRIPFADSLNASFNSISPPYFSTLGIRVIEGRMLRPGDEFVKPIPVVVTESFARHFYPGVKVLGKTFGTGRPGDAAIASKEIVGIVSDSKYRTMRELPPPTVYEILNQDAIRFGDGLSLYVRTRGAARTPMRQLRDVLSRIGSGLAPTELATMEQDIDASLWQERLLATLGSAFAGVSVLLAGLGLFGMLSYAVSRRTREIGIRVAIGASASRIASLILRDTGWSILPGIVAGLGIYAVAARSIVPLLYGVTPWSVRTSCMALGTLLLAATVASLLPVSRALSVHPAEALRID